MDYGYQAPVGPCNTPQVSCTPLCCLCCPFLRPVDTVLVSNLCHTHLNECVEDLKDLFLDENRENGAVINQLPDELLNPRQEDLHRCQQWLPLICFSVPEVQTLTHSDVCTQSLASVM